MVVPDARKNLLAEINRAESTVLPAPPPPQQETLAVFLRIKPKSAQETEMVRGQEEEERALETVKIENEHQVALLAPPSSQTYKNSINGSGAITTRFVFVVIFIFLMQFIIRRFAFSKVLKPEISQKEIFTELVCPKMKEFLHGQNQLLFTYGATSTGKTYTIQGVKGEEGIIPRAIDTLFNSVAGRLAETCPIQPQQFSGITLLGEAGCVSSHSDVLVINLSR